MLFAAQENRCHHGNTDRSHWIAMVNKPLRGLARLGAAIIYSLAGLRDAWREEEAFRIEARLFILSIPLAIWLGEGGGQIAMLICSGLFLLVVEVLNTAVEAVVDRIGPERHDLSRTAKDLGSTAVFLAALVPAVVWGTVVLNRLGLVDF